MNSEKINEDLNITGNGTVYEPYECDYDQSVSLLAENISVRDETARRLLKGEIIFFELHYCDLVGIKVGFDEDNKPRLEALYHLVNGDYEEVGSVSRALITLVNLSEVEEKTRKANEILETFKKSLGMQEEQD